MTMVTIGRAHYNGQSMGRTTGKPAFDMRQKEASIFVFHLHRPWDANSDINQREASTISMEIKWQRYEANSSLSSNTVIKNAWSYTTIPNNTSPIAITMHDRNMVWQATDLKN
jgi:hypothetical protein